MYNYIHMYKLIYSKEITPNRFLTLALSNLSVPAKQMITLLSNMKCYSTEENYVQRNAQTGTKKERESETKT